MHQTISHKDAAVIIDTRKPEGLFLVEEQDGTFTGIDNSAGNAFTENFPKKEMAIFWLENDEFNKPLPVTEAQKTFIALEKCKATFKVFFDELSAATKSVVAEIGTDAYFQDEEGTVYKTFNQEGKFVYFEPVAIKRTRRPDEPSSGTNLSIKEAKEAGFVIPEK